MIFYPFEPQCNFGKSAPQHDKTMRMLLQLSAGKKDCQDMGVPYSSGRFCPCSGQLEKNEEKVPTCWLLNLEINRGSRHL